MAVGWGRSTWGDGPWGQPAVTLVDVTGQAATSSLGTLSVVAKANVTPASQVGTTNAPVVIVNAQAIATIQGATGTVGTVSVDVDGEANVPVAGLGSTRCLRNYYSSCK